MNIQKYSVALLTSFERNKTTSAVARESDESQSTASRFLHKIEIKANDFVSMIKTFFGNKKLIMALDDFVLSRRYSQETEGTSSMIDQSIKAFTNGIKIVGAGVTDGKYFLPFDLEQWIAEFIAGDAYLKKTKIAQKLILRSLEFGLNVEYFVLDGLYFCADFINFLNDKKLKFVIKAKTTTKVKWHDTMIQLQECPGLRLNSNQNQKKIVAEWNGKKWYFIAVRRTGKHGPKIIYLIANFNAKAKKYRKIYDGRWPIEKKIRTGKQSLGLKGSFSQQASVYLNHIRLVYFAYCIAQFIMKRFRLSSIEEAIRKAQALKIKFGFAKTVDELSLLVNYA